MRAFSAVNVVSTALLLALSAPAVRACGYCVEDKIASVYDHAVVTRALAQKHHVVYFHIDGLAAAPAGASAGAGAGAPGSARAVEATRRALERLGESTPGVDQGSVRVAVETFTIALAFDPQRTTLPAVVAALDQKFAARKLVVMPLRVIDKPAEMKSVNR